MPRGVTCTWCRDSMPAVKVAHDDSGRVWHPHCLIAERDMLESYYREAVDALGTHLQSGGRYAFLMSPGESITRLGPGRLVTFFQNALANGRALLEAYKAHHAHFHAACNIDGPPVPPRVEPAEYA